jgi:3-methyladenine DNA glycosylase AlkC
MALLKDLYSPGFYKNLANALTEIIPSFNKQRFTSQIFTDDFSDKELKARMRHTTEVLRGFMPSDFSMAAQIIGKLIQQLKKNGTGGDQLAYIFLPDYIELYGIDDFDAAVKAIESVTQFISCEFAVRPFILRYESKMMQQMKKWASHSNERVRRLASEGSRPRLPWAMAIPALKKDPSSILPILEKLKTDSSESVRRSVANNLNDIAKDHPELVIGIAKKWKGISKETDAIIRHGSRTLLKQGHEKILSHYGLKSKQVAITSLAIKTPNVPDGGDLQFSFRVTNLSDKKQTIRLEYGLYYNKANQQMARKVFKISEKSYGAGESKTVEKKQSFKKITTRVYYPGKHKLSIIANGEEKTEKSFILKA